MKTFNLIIITLVFILIILAILNMQFVPPKIIYQTIPVEVENTELADYWRRQYEQQEGKNQELVKHLLSVIEYNRLEMNRLNDELGEMQLKNGELGFKVSVYKAMTGVDIEVRSEPVR